MAAITSHVHGDKFNIASEILAAHHVSPFDTKELNKYEGN
jgi:hypothetical protein